VPYKHSRRKIPEKETVAQKAKRLREEQLNDIIRAEFKKLNVTLSLIPGGYTGYVQVLDVAINSLLKALIQKLKEIYIDRNLKK
jgi:hypothetical protein